MLAIAIGIGVMIGSVAGYITTKTSANPVSQSSLQSALSSEASPQISQPAQSVISSSSQPVSSKAEVSSQVSSSSAVTPSSSALPNYSTVPQTTPPTSDAQLQKLYPNFYVAPTEKIAHKDGDKVAYLTFDDGPSALTPKVLQVLKENDVKATFFVVGRSDEQSKKIMKQIVDEGHTIAMHTYTHSYKQIYASPEACLKDLSKLRDLIVDATGVEPQLMRFAGGSINSYNKGFSRQITNEVTRRGYTYFDWNVSAGDAEKGATRQSIYNDTINQSLRVEKAVVLFHDSGTKHDTLAELPKIIETLKKNGYRFDKLDASVKPIIFKPSAK